MFSRNVCDLPVTGGSLGLITAALFALVVVVIGTALVRFVRSSTHSLSVIAMAPILLLGVVTSSSTNDECVTDAASPS
ncbi:MAG: hypothetical protein RLY19_706, partial [Actinomycetota bacterium]